LAAQEYTFSFINDLDQKLFTVNPEISVVAHCFVRKIWRTVDLFAIRQT